MSKNKVKLDKFQAWIKENKIKNISKLMDIDGVTVWKWFKRTRVPRPAIALKITKLSKLSFDDIYRPFAIKQK